MATMQDDYSWNGSGGSGSGSSSYHLPENEGQGRWVVTALVVALLLHVIAFFGLSQIDVILPDLVKTDSIQTEVVRVNPVDLEDSRPEVTPPEDGDEAEPVEVVPPVDELEMLEALPDIDIDISPEIDQMQVPKVSSAAAGALDGEMMEPMKAPNFEPELPEMGVTEDFFPKANDSQVTVDPGARMAEEFDPDEFTEMMRQGAEGEAEDGLLKDFTTLDQMANMDGNSLLTSKALIGSDLLFDFNKAELRQSARVSLMKVALLIHKHPKLVCWVDGHTDLIGGEEANRELSVKRAMAVKRWLVDAMEIDQTRVAVRGFGKTSPIVKEGSAEQQAPNRRVEIKMRKSRPEQEVSYRAEALKAPRATEVDESDEGILVKPKIPKPESMPRAIPVAEDPVAPRAIVEPEEQPRRRALVVPEDPPASPARAVPVNE